MLTAQELITLLNLEKLPEEGGHFHQTYLCPVTVSANALPGRYDKAMSLGTAIYYLLTSDDFSAMHRLASDEIYHFYYGDPVDLLLLHPDSTGELFRLGVDFEAGERPQKLVPHGTWQGSRLAPNGRHGFALIGTTMTPAFDWDGFELGQREALVAAYPAFAHEIGARCRG